MGDVFHRLCRFSIRGCLELLNRTAREIAGHLKENLGECIRQIHTHLRRLCPGLRSFGVFRSREFFFFKTKFYSSIPDSSLLFYRRLFDFNKAVILCECGGKIDTDERSLSPLGYSYLIISCVLCID